MEKRTLHIGDGRDKLEIHRGRLTAIDVLRRYMDLTDVNQAELFRERPLDVAACRGNLEKIYALLDGGAEIDALANSAIQRVMNP